MDKSKHSNPAMTDTRQRKNNPVERLVVIGSGGCGFRLGGDGLGTRPRGCGINGRGRWTGLEPSVGEEDDDEEGDSEEDEVSAAAGGTVLGSEAKIRVANSSEGGPTRGSGGRGRSSGDPGRRCELVEGG
ncbi:Os07g0153700 [Oryza sativa Japonica Group]|uniref:Os07g0153700 protein n=1 Tax=Oryza sativa subsp. japonica TaxID=39947 RepID=A0A0P0X2C2_ORYSJ|nr:Os07g0153700 [Oryza sativa Japonica Group]